MKKHIIGFCFLIFVFSLSSAYALQCGDIITENTILTEDILNCHENGLIIGANNIVLDCDGHLIIGDGEINQTNPFYGIYMSEKKENIIKNCIVSKFYHGIYLYNATNKKNYPE